MDEIHTPNIPTLGYRKCGEMQKIGIKKGRAVAARDSESRQPYYSVARDSTVKRG